MIRPNAFYRSPSDSGGFSDSAAGWQGAYLESTSDSLLALVVETGLVAGFNPAVVDLLGYPPDALMGMHFSGLLPPLTANAKTPVGRRFPLTGEVAEVQVFRHAAGHEVLCDVLVSAVRSTPQELAVLHLRDVRARETARQVHRDTEEAAIASAKSEDVVRVIEQYMSHVSHELRTPLAVILSSSSMLERYYARLNEAKREEHFQRIQTQVKYLTEFLDNLRFFSRLNAGNIQLRPDPTDAAVLVQEIINDYGAHPQRPNFALHADNLAEILHFDGLLWRRALLPLIGNAVKYGRQGGNIEIHLLQHGDMLETRVRDDGPGLPADYLPLVFVEFRRGENTADEPGGGLGLAIAARSALLLGGSLTFETQAGLGTTFILVVPVK